MGADVTDGCQLNSGQRESAIVIIIWNVEAAVACSFVCQSDFARNWISAIFADRMVLIAKFARVLQQSHKVLYSSRHLPNLRQFSVSALLNAGEHENEEYRWERIQHILQEATIEIYATAKWMSVGHREKE